MSRLELISLTYINGGAMRPTSLLFDQSITGISLFGLQGMFVYLCEYM